jgi:5,10-methylene-tetrahydrofolate dehydrogenase/methenyl tetrahydrofolate cyclohydrolase
LDGRAIAQQILSEISAAVKPHSQSPPGLAVILVGSRADSMRYVSHKQKAAQSVGFKSHFSHFPDDVTQAEVMAKIDEWNNAAHINGILVQLPLPAHLDQARILSSISVHKDVDGFHPLNFGCLALRRAGEFAPWENRSASTTSSSSNKPLPSFSWTNVPCTPKACLEILDRHQIPIAHRTVVVLGRSNIVGTDSLPVLISFVQTTNYHIILIF